MIRFKTQHLLPLLACLIVSLGACSENEKRPPPTAPSTTPPTAPPPVYESSKIESSLLRVTDLGKKWTEGDVIDAFKERGLRGCSDSRIKLPGRPKVTTEKFGAPKFETTGANYARLVAVYPDAAQAADAMTGIGESLRKCPKERKVPLKKLPKDKFIYPHNDTWELTEQETSGWSHLKGFEKVTYPSSVSIINVIYFSYDYVQRGNVVFSSVYWRRVKPKESRKPIAEKAAELLTEQLKRFG